MAEEFEGHTDLVDSIIFENPEKGIQYRFTISEFRDKHYIGVRSWFQDYNGEYLPTQNGFTMPYNLHSTSALFNSLIEILSEAEVLNQVIEKKNEAVN